MGIREAVYNLLVRTNKNVQKEYEQYVKEHILEHYQHRTKHWKILWKLNSHYRIKKKESPLLYYDINDNNDRKVNINQSSINANNSTSGITLKNNNQCNNKKTLIFPESKSIQRMSKEKLIEILNKYDTISFDVFDTLVFRYIDDPKDLFWLVGNDLHIPNFKKVRSDIEKKLRQFSPCHEVTLNDIYEVISERFGIVKEEGIKLELDYEQRLCFANTYMLGIYNELKQNNKKIIVTSNMYINKLDLEKILISCGYKEFDNIYVSCDNFANKKNGKLQKVISQELGDTNIIHVGDNYLVDVEGSRCAGWKAIYYKNVNQIGREYRPKNMSILTGGIFKGIVNTTLYSGYELNPYYEYGYAYVGYLVYGFCKWLDELGKSKNIDKFLFFARDMKVVYEAYTKYFNHINCEYVLGSRTASIHLAFETHIEHFYDWHIRRRINSNIIISQVLEELYLDYLVPYLEEIELLENEILTNDNADKVRKLLYKNKELILSVYQEEKKAAKKYYLDKIGDSKNVCMVDLGWKASTSHSLEPFLKDYCGIDINLITALIGTEGHSFVDSMTSNGKVYPYVFSSQLNTELMRNHNTNGNIWRRLYEIIFTSNEQSLHKFTLNKVGKVEPIFFKKEIRDEIIVDNIHKGILDFIKDYYKVEKLIGSDLSIYSSDCYRPLGHIFSNTDYNLELFKNFEVRFLAGEGKENNIELFNDVVKLERK
ncbi:MAG: HAD-IA family hydrolase [Lachnospiraceae bacterium]